MIKDNYKKQFKILAIESSCDETAAAVVEVNKSYEQLRTVANSCEKLQLFATNRNQQQPIVTILSNIVSSQVKLHAKYGGVYPELASREHLQNILPVVTKSCEQLQKVTNSYEKLRKVNSSYERLLQNATNRNQSKLIETIRNQIDYLAVTTGPGLIGSLLVGTNTAKTLAYALKKPIYAINHLEGHIYSCFTGEFSISNFQFSNKYQIQNSDDLNIKNCKIKSLNENCKLKIENSMPQFPLVALVVSGGHTSLVYIKDHFDYQVIGETLDDAAGEAFDKVAKLLGLGYPGGPAISALAEKFSIYNSQFSNKFQISNSKKLNIENSKIKSLNENCKLKTENSFSFPRPMIDSPNFDFSFSGLKTSVLYTVNKLKSQNSNLKTTTKSSKLKDEIVQLICKEFQEAVIDTLVTKTLRAAEKYKVKSILLCGGVSANSRLREEFTETLNLKPYNYKLFVPSKSLSTDNAAMIGIAAAYRIALGKKPTPWYNVNTDANLRLR